MNDMTKWALIIVTALNLAFSGGVLYQRVVYLESTARELKAEDSRLDGLLRANDVRFTEILTMLARIEERLQIIHPERR